MLEMALIVFIAPTSGFYNVSIHDRTSDLKITLICIHRLLGHLYAAESLVLLNRLNEAIPHLHPDNVSQLTAEEIEETSNATQGKPS